MQAAGESALASFGLPGAFITMDVHDGQILGMGSLPTFDPTVFTQPMTQSQVDQLYRDPVLAPLTNRATESYYPTGSTFKAITALAALENGQVSLTEPIFDNGSITIGGQEFQNAGGAAFGPVDMVHALQVSSDVYFYTLGLRMWETNQLQRWAAKLGIGKESGLDLPGETEGLVPSKKWRDDLFAEGGTERPWSAGDNIQLADRAGRPADQPAADGDRLRGARPTTAPSSPRTSGMEVEDAAGRVLKEFDPAPRRKIKIDSAYRAAILEGLHQAAQAPGGTSYGVFGGFPVEVAGKTGTVERPGHADQSWYAVLAPYPDPRIVTIVTDRGRRLRRRKRRPGRAADPRSLFRQAGEAETGAANGGSPG